jgi:hypothetical protein
MEQAEQSENGENETTGAHRNFPGGSGAFLDGITESIFKPSFTGKEKGSPLPGKNKKPAWVLTGAGFLSEAKC